MIWIKYRKIQGWPLTKTTCGHPTQAHAAHPSLGLPVVTRIRPLAPLLALAPQALHLAQKDPCQLMLQTRMKSALSPWV